MYSNCWIAALVATYRHNRSDGPKLAIIPIPTKRIYWWPWKVPHVIVRYANGREIEFVPIKKTLGVLPLPLFKGHWKRRKGEEHG